MEYEPRYVHQYNNESADSHTVKKNKSTGIISVSASQNEKNESI